MKKVIYCVSLLAVGYAAGRFSGDRSRGVGLSAERREVVRIVRDTIRVESPRSVGDRTETAVTRRLPLAELKSSRLSTESVATAACRAMELADSLAQTADTATVIVPVTMRTYSDSMTYRAVVSGFEPRLDTLVIYPSPRVEVVAPTVVTERTRRHWGIGLTAGAAVTSRGIAPGLTVGVTYTFAAF